MSSLQGPFIYKPAGSTGGTGGTGGGGGTTVTGLALEPVVNGEEIVFAGEAGDCDVLTVAVEVT